MLPLELAKLTALMERTSGSPEVKIGLIDGPVVTQHPDLAANTSARFREVRRHVHAAQQHGVPARDLCRRNLIRNAEFSGARHLPRLYAPDSPHFRRKDHGQRTNAQRDAATSLPRRSSNVSMPARESST